MVKQAMLLMLIISVLCGCQSKEEQENQTKLAESTLMVKNLSEIRLGNYSYDKIGEGVKRYKSKMQRRIYNEWFDVENANVQDYLRYPTISMNTIIQEYEMDNQQFTYNNTVYQYWLVYKGKYHVSEEIEESKREGRVKIYFYYEFNTITHKLDKTNMEVVIDE